MIGKSKTQPKKGMIEITPEKDYDLKCPPHFSGKLVAGESIEIPLFLKPSLVTEGVIKERK